MAAKKPKDPNAIGLFDWVNAASWHKQPIMTADNQPSYDIFMATRTLSMNKDFTPTMDFINSLDVTDKFMHFELVRTFLEKPLRKPYSKFVKKEALSEELKLVSEYFNININVARTYMDRLTEEDFDRMRDELNPEQGGKGKLKRA